MMNVKESASSTLIERRDPVFQVAGIGLALVDFEGRILRANPALERLFEAADPGLAGMHLHELCPPPHAKVCFDMIQEVSLDDGAAQAQELRVRTATGRYLWVHVTAARFMGDDELPPCIVLSVHDSSDYFELQEEMQARAEGRAARP
ncbi:MAG: PAS domain S-box protein [Desulfuromonadales bacterium]|nr:PAS domain S-box protein [Desulfuromonadales bacterium]NIR33056.1 PAS domain S-box protein [Desulfuromonadales bacterium]NIS39294.1 PAS domain S-box protein [Desulfuromonadales bacterium]